MNTIPKSKRKSGETVVVYHNNKPYTKFKIGESRKDSMKNKMKRVAHKTESFMWRITKRYVILPAIIATLLFIVADRALNAYASSKAPKIVEVEKVVEVKTIPPILKKISKCESGSKQTKTNGRVTRGVVNHSDIGLYQINEVIWNDVAREKGWDIFTEEGNTAMALYLFENYGSAPWSSSSACWSKL